MRFIIKRIICRKFC